MFTLSQKMSTEVKNNIAIFGCGNIASAILDGFHLAGDKTPLVITRSASDAGIKYRGLGFEVTTDIEYPEAEDRNIWILCVPPGAVKSLLTKIKHYIKPNTTIISVATGVSISDIKTTISGVTQKIVRAMPNTAASYGRSMTCICASNKEAEEVAVNVFKRLGKTHIILENKMNSATVLCACGIAFFSRMIRAFTQGGVEIGFHADEALYLATQTAMGACDLIFNGDVHPEVAIDKVTTPNGCTITGLNTMEHEGVSSAIVKGITSSFEKANRLIPSPNVQEK